MSQPHQMPAITGETVVRKAPVAPETFEWEEAPDAADAPPRPADEEPPATSHGDVRRGSGEPVPTPAQPTLPRSVSPAALRTLRRLSGGTTVPVAPAKAGKPSTDEPEADKPPTDKPPAGSPKHPGGDAPIAAAPETAPAVAAPGSPADSRPDSAASSQRQGLAGSSKTQPSETQSADPRPTEPRPALGEAEPGSSEAEPDGLEVGGWADLTEEVAEIQFLQLQGFDDEAREAVTPLAKAHPGHPDLAPICAALDIPLGRAEPSSDAPATPQPASAAKPEGDAPVSGSPSAAPPSSALSAQEDPSQDNGDAPADAPAESLAPEPPALDASAPAVDVVDDDDDAAAQDEFIEINIDITAPRMKAPPELVARSPADLVPDAADRTVVTAGLHSPRPFLPDDAPPSPTEQTPQESAQSPTFVTGTEPPPGGFVEPQPGTPRTLVPRLTPKLGLSVQSEAKVPPRSADSMITSPRIPAVPAGASDDEPVTVVAAAPSEGPAPVPHGDAGVSAKDRVRLVMLGARGQAVAERIIATGGTLVLSRDPTEPWGDDKHLQEEHARLQPAVGGGVMVEGWGTGRVFRQVDERLRVRDGDLIRVGQSLVRYTATPGGWGTLTGYPLSGDAMAPITVGGSGATVGRDSGELVIPDDTYISGAHCQFSCRGDDLFIEDLGSANGTYVLVRSGESVPFGGLLLAGQTQFKVRRASTRR